MESYSIRTLTGNVDLDLAEIDAEMMEECGITPAALCPLALPAVEPDAFDLDPDAQWVEEMHARDERDALACEVADADDAALIETVATTDPNEGPLAGLLVELATVEISRRVDRRTPAA